MSQPNDPNELGPALSEPARSDPAQPAPANQGPEGDWQRLSPLTLAVTTGWIGGLAVIGAIIALVSGAPPLIVLPAVPVVVLVSVGMDYVRWTRAAYRITAERLELRSGILVRTHKSVPRDRIRSVDLAADIVYRIFGVTKVQVGTAQNAGSGDSAELELDPLTKAQGEQLRTELLRRDNLAADGAAGSVDGAAVDGAALGDGQPSGDQVAAPATGPATGAAATEIARLDWSWIRFAPVGILTPVLGGAAVGALFQVAGWFNSLPWQLSAARPITDPFMTMPIVIVIAIATIVFLIVGAIAATAIWIESWWDYRLERESGVFRVRRGLLTSRSISLEANRLRGIELVEPLTLRRFRVGYTNAVATGMQSKSDQEKGADKKALLPSAPVPVAEGVAAAVLDETTAPTVGAKLVGHPRAARRRRLLWSLTTVTVPVVILVVLGLMLTDLLLWIALPVAIVGYLAAPLLALDAYRNLGHGYTQKYFLARHGTAARRTVALQRSGIIGWKMQQTIFQRRAGILTISATTAAGNGEYHAYDTDLSEGLAFADEAVPGLLRPFLERDDEPAEATPRDLIAEPRNG